MTTDALSVHWKLFHVETPWPPGWIHNAGIPLSCVEQTWHNGLPQCINNDLAFEGVQCNKLPEYLNVEFLAVKWNITDIATSTVFSIWLLIRLQNKCDFHATRSPCDLPCDTSCDISCDPPPPTHTLEKPHPLFSKVISNSPFVQ